MPFKFVPLAPNASMQELISVMNANFAQLDNETVTKTFKQANGNAIIEGKLPYEGGYGSIYYDSDGLARVIIGILPNGEMGVIVSKEGEDALDLFS